MRSPLEAIEGAFEHAVFTTYSVNLHFFEHWVLPLLRKAGVRNTVIFADHRQLAVALQDRSLHALGRSYHVVSTRIGPGAFHPKLMVLSGDGGTRACVSSANLTIDGQLRNLEAGVVLDTRVPDHLQAVRDVDGFLRGISEHAPPHTAEALLAALPEHAAPVPGSPIRIVHNLEEPLVRHFPGGSEFVAVAPFSDAGAAAQRLSESGPLELITDAAAFAAPDAFFAGEWVVTPRTFVDRGRLHGKAYWVRPGSGDGWLFVGSPNLSEPALLRRAAQGNTEIGVLFSPSAQAQLDPGGEPWDGQAFETLATRRHLQARAAADRADTIHSFNAWEDEDSIRLPGIPDTSRVEHWDGLVWIELGHATDGQIRLPDDVRPYLIRVTLPNGTHAQAVVHRPARLLQQRLRPRVTSRAADVASNLPLDLPGVRALEGLLADLYALDQLAGEQRAQPGPDTIDVEQDVDHLSDWSPAQPGDEPRVGDIYRRAWGNEPDALLALIRHALRLDRPAADDERELGDERIELGETGEADPPPEEPPPPVPVARKVLHRYRSSLTKLLDRGAEFIRRAERPVLADLAFQTVLRLHEQLAALIVTVDDEDVRLIEPDVLRREKLALLEAYLRDRDGSDSHCLATARIHLADCLALRELWTPLEWEALEALTYRCASRVLAQHEYVSEAAEDAGVDPADVAARLERYARRSDWLGYFDEAENLLFPVDYDDEPIVWAAGDARFGDIDASPAWALIGYGAIAGFASKTRYAAAVRNANNHCPHTFHALAVDPVTGVLVEAARRRADGRWLTRRYRPVRARHLDTAGRVGPAALLEACTRSAFQVTAHDELIQMVPLELVEFADRPGRLSTSG